VNLRISLLALEPLQVLSTFSDDLLPEYIARDHLDNIFITDRNRVLVFDRANNRIGAWGTTGFGDGEFQRPLGIAVQREASGPFSVRRVYVVDSANDRIQKFDASGGFIAKWGSAGSGPGQFIDPIGVGVRGNVYVADLGNDRIQVFTPGGAYVTQWPVPGPVGIAFDSAGNLFVTSNTDEVRKYTAAGQLITRWGGRGTGDGKFDAPAGIAVDSAGDVYVVDSENDRVQKFKKE
jgi:tripartite motif-containing protein 71